MSDLSNGFDEVYVVVAVYGDGSGTPDVLAAFETPEEAESLCRLIRRVDGKSVDVYRAPTMEVRVDA